MTIENFVLKMLKKSTFDQFEMSVKLVKSCSLAFEQKTVFEGFTNSSVAYLFISHLINHA